MDELSEYAAIKMLNAPLVPGFRIPHWFKPEYVKYMFPVDRRPLSLVCTPPTPSTILTPSSLGELFQTSSRRLEDKSRREAMHTLLTGWDKSAKTTARDLVNVLFRGFPCNPSLMPSRPLPVGGVDFGDVAKFLSLIPGSDSESAHAITAQFSPAIPNAYPPMFTSGGFSLTETVGPLAMLTRVVKQRSIVFVWVREKVRMSHGTRKVKIVKREGKIVLFDRFMNIVFVPLGNATDHWQFIRGATVAIVQVK